MRDTTTKINNLIADLKRASEAYYKFDKPIMTDQEYDSLYDELEKLEKQAHEENKKYKSWDEVPKVTEDQND